MGINQTGKWKKKQKSPNNHSYYDALWNVRFSPLNRRPYLPQIKQLAIKNQNDHDEQTLRPNDTVVFEALRNSQVYSKVTK